MPILNKTFQMFSLSFLVPDSLNDGLKGSQEKGQGVCSVQSVCWLGQFAY